VIALNAKCNVLGRRKISTGSLSEVSAYPRLVLETALNYNAHSVLLCHNHPGGTCAPSPEDISSTLQLQRLLNGVGILVLDHIIVAGTNTYSMIQHGDIDYRIRNRI
jgi:DNA repair protein RadC